MNQAEALAAYEKAEKAFNATRRADPNYYKLCGAVRKAYEALQAADGPQQWTFTITDTGSAIIGKCGTLVVEETYDLGVPRQSIDGRDAAIGAAFSRLADTFEQEAQSGEGQGHASGR